MTLAINQRAIQPLNLWLNGVQSTATIIMLDGYSGYNFVDNAGEVHYNLQSYDAATDTATTILAGVVQLDIATVEQWGADDQIIFNYVAQQLNITLI